LIFEAGDIVGGHRILELAGSGGMGTVYKTEHLLTRRVEAMKVLSLGIGSGDDEIARFEREIQVQARLQHPNIAALYGASRERGAIALVMEYVEGESLARLLERQRLSIEQAARYARQVLEALAYAHSLGVFHCDVTPANILVSAGGVVKLTDFGLARAATDLGLTNSGAANAGVAVGSPWHMSPEQVRGADPLDSRTDVYAMGSVLYEMLTGRKLFEVEGAFAIMRAHIDVIPALPSVHRRDVSPALDAVIVKALAKDAGERFQNAGEFLRALDAALLAPGRRAAARRVLLRRVWIGVGMGSVVCAAVLQSRSLHRAPDEPVAAVPVLEAAAPSIPSPYMVPPPRPAPDPEPAAPPLKRSPSLPKAAAVNSVRRLEPRAVLQTAAADAALPDAPEVEPLRVETAPPAIPVEGKHPAIEEPKRPAGNRFVRAIGKLNPFRKGDKDAPAEKKP
jgi:serine/threonine-protein kinase